ncbi:MAG: outer membrane protein assembly factor BamD [Methylophilaceae bacterium]
MNRRTSLALLVLLTLFCISGCAIFGEPTELDETKGWGPQKIHDAGEDAMRHRDYEKATKYYQIVEVRFPHGKYATQSQLDIAYAYYKKPDPAAAVAAAERFIKLHPHHPNVDYAYYLKGLATFNERGMVEKLVDQEISDRDPKAQRESFAAFKDLVTRFPESKYAKDAFLRMNYLVNNLAENELHVARYYMKRGAFLAAANRCKYVIEKYPESPSQEEALIILISAYESLGLEDYQQDTLRVLKANFPKSRFLTGEAPPDRKTWWKFWDGWFANK